MLKVTHSGFVTPDGNEVRFGVVARDHPVEFHKHAHGHTLTVCGVAWLDSAKGRVKMLPGQPVFVEAGEEHSISVPAESCGYVCIGRAPL